MDNIKRILLLCITILFFVSCESKKTCPVCLGEGSIIIYGKEQQCLTCNGKGKLTNEEYKSICNILNKLKQTNPRNNNINSDLEQMVTCPFCNGCGTYGTYTCGFCNGAGKVPASAASQGRHVIEGGSVNDSYPSSSSNKNNNKNNRSSSDNSCHYCHGTGECQHCRGTGLVEYEGHYNTEGGIMKCPICKGTKKCNVCYGTGHI